ncbi:MAG: class I SAM-dependent methyltransferase [Verrucomicrobiales bacterium]|nr:class I SAM-dependent methyltransferase [Verrucomicrobiales bacterium]
MSPLPPDAARRPCPVCQAETRLPWRTKGTLHLVRCTACRMVFADPLPPESEAAHYDQLGRPFYLSADKLEGDFASVRFTRELRLLRRFASEGSVLDVGCSTGAFLHQVRTRWPDAYQVTGIDVSTAALDHARSHGIEVVADSLLTHDFGARRFDVVTFWAVLEHLPDPLSFLERARHWLRPEGVCLVLVPNLAALGVRLLGTRYRYILPQHVNYFEAGTLERLTRQAGLSPIARGGSHFNPIVLWQDWRRGSDELVPDRERAALLRRTTRWKQSLIATPARLGLSLAEKLLAAMGCADNLWLAARRP